MSSPDLGYYAEYDFPSERLLDLRVTYNRPDDSLSVRAGQSHLAISRSARIKNRVGNIAPASMLVLVLAFVITQSTRAGEGGSSNYFPGTYGDYAVATAPSQGWTYANYSLLYTSEADRAALQGRLNTNLETSAYINMSALVYAFEKTVLGSQFAMGGFVPVGYADLETTLTGPLTRSSTALLTNPSIPRSSRRMPKYCVNTT